MEIRNSCHSFQLVVFPVFITVDTNAKVDLVCVRVVVGSLLERVHVVGRPARDMIEKHCEQSFADVRVLRLLQRADSICCYIAAPAGSSNMNPLWSELGRFGIGSGLLSISRICR